MSSRRTALLLASALLSLPIPAAPGQVLNVTTPVPDAVEEDWQLVVATPDPIGVGPQITTVMSPSGDTSSPFVAFDMNYQEVPVFYPGGMQVQVWSGGKITSSAGQGSALFNTPAETVTWTQRMALSGGTVTYAVENGSSTTWGKFGQGSNLSVSFTSSLTSLAGYSPTASVSKSGASWQMNNVTSLKITQVRYYANNQLILTDSTPKVLIGSAN